VSAEDTGLARSSSVMAAGTVVSRLTGFVRNLVLAAAIGTAVLADTYNVANTVPNILYILLIGGVLNAVFVPQLVRAMKAADRGEAYANRLLTVTGLILLAITVAAVVAAPLVVRAYAGNNWTETDLSVATAFARWCLPQIFFYGLFTMLGQVLNARGSFGPMMWAPVLNNVVVIATGLLFIALATEELAPATISSGQIQLLGIGTTLGVVVQAVVLLPALRSTGFRLRPRLDLRGSGLGRAGGLATWTLLFVLVNQAGYLVIVRLATTAGKAAQAVVDYGAGYTPYTYAYLFFVLPHAIVTVSVVTALLPRMSAAAADGRLADVRDDVSTGLRLTAVALVPASLVFLALGREIATVLLVGTDPASARYVGWVLTAFAVGLVPFSTHHLVLRGFYALEDTRTPFYINVCIVVVNVAAALAAYIVLPARWAVVGLAGAFSFAYAVGLVVSIRLLRRRIGGLDGQRVMRTYLRLALAGGVAALVAWALCRLVVAAVGDGAAAEFAGVLTGLGAGALVFGWVAVRLHVLEVRTLVATVTDRVTRARPRS